MNWMAPYGNILTIIAPLPLYKPRKPSFFGTALRVENTPAKKDQKFQRCGREVWKHLLPLHVWLVVFYLDVCSAGSGPEAESWLCPEEQWSSWHSILLHLDKNRGTRGNREIMYLWLNIFSFQCQCERLMRFLNLSGAKLAIKQAHHPEERLVTDCIKSDWLQLGSFLFEVTWSQTWKVSLHCCFTMSHSFMIGCVILICIMCQEPLLFLEGKLFLLTAYHSGVRSGLLDS